MTEIERYKKLINIGWTYNETTGLFLNSYGKVCSNTNKDGYIQMVVLDVNKKPHCVMGHRFAFFLKNGFLPNVIDHINNDRSDNRISNIRSVDYKENNRNQKSPRGFYKRKDYDAFQSQITVDGKTVYLGVYRTEVEAKDAYIVAKKLYHYGC